MDYGSGFVTIKGDLERRIHKKIREDDFKDFDCDKYVISLSEKEVDDIFREGKVTWIQSGRYNQDYPRDYKGKPKSQK